MNKIKSFFIGALKIAVAIMLAIALLSIIGWGIYSYKQKREMVKNEPLRKPRIWPSITVPSLDNSTFKLSTTWRDGELAYQFKMSGFPKELENSFRRGIPHFTLTFLDENGFKLYEHIIVSSDIVRMVDDKGKGIGVQSKGQIYVNADTYRDTQSWEVTWSF